jgi:hypothetical protein
MAFVLVKLPHLVRKIAAAIKPKKVTGIDRRASGPKPTHKPTLNCP